MSNIRIFCFAAGFIFIPALITLWIVAGTAATFGMYGKAAILAAVFGALQVALWGK